MAGHTLSYMATLNSSGFMTGLNQMLSGLSGFSGSLNGLKSALGGLGKLLTNPFVLGAAAVTGIALALGSATAAAMQWEDQMANVAKTTGMTGQVLADMSKNILDISTNSRTSQQDLAAIAATGGTLGISDIDKLTGFTEDINMMTVAFDMTGEEAATQMAHVANSFNAPIEQVQQMGNSINILGNNFATTERDIISALEAIAPIAKQYNETIADSAAYSTVLLQQGVDPSEVGTGLQSALKVAAGDPKKMSAWADLMGISVDELNQKLSTDLYGTLQQSGDALSSVENEVERNALAMELWGAYGGKQIGKLIGQEENLARAREMANEQYGIAAGDQGALVDEYNAKNNTSLGIISQIKNTIGAMVIEMGGVVNSSSLMQGALTGIHSALITIRDVGHKAFDFLKTSDITKSLGSMTSGIQKYISSMTGTLSKLFDPIKQSIEKVFGEGAIGKGIGALFNNLTNGAEAAFEIIGKGFEMLASGVEALGPIFETVGKGIGEAVEWAGALSKTIKEYSSGSSTIQKIGDAFEKLKSPIETVKTAWEGFTNAMPTAVSGAVDAIQTLFQKFFDWLDEKLNIGDTIKEKLGIGEGGFIDSLLKNKEEIENVGKEVGQEFTEEALAQTDGLAPGIEEDLMNTDAGSAGSSKGAEFVENFEESLKAMELADYYSNVGERPNTTEFNIGPEIGDTGFSIGKRTARGKKEEWAIFTDTGHKSFEAEELSTGVGWLPFLREQLGEITPLMQLYIDLSEAVAVKDEDSAIALRKKIDETLAYQEALEEFMNTGVILDFDKAWEDFSKDAANVFSDNLVSGVEASNMIERLTTLKSTDKDAFERMGGDAAIEWWSGLEALIKERSETLAIDPNADVSKMDEQIREYLKDNPYTVELTGEITDIFGNVEPEQLMFNFAENWEETVKKIKDDVTDWNLFRENVALPALKQSLEHEKQLLSTGSESNYKVVKDYIDDLVKLYGEMPEAFGKAEIELINSLSSAYNRGAPAKELIGLIDEYTELSNKTDKVTKSTNKMYDAYANLETCLATTWSAWQDANRGDLFAEPFYGSKGDYVKNITEKLINGEWVHPAQISMVANIKAEANSNEQLAKDLGVIETVADIDGDPTKVNEDVENLITSVETAVPEMTIGAFAGPAYDTLGWLVDSIWNTYAEITIGANTSALPTGTIPAYAEGGYVESPTLALVGEAGPEWVVNENQMEELLNNSEKLESNPTKVNTLTVNELFDSFFNKYKDKILASYDMRDYDIQGNLDEQVEYINHAYSMLKNKLNNVNEINNLAAPIEAKLSELNSVLDAVTSTMTPFEYAQKTAEKREKDYEQMVGWLDYVSWSGMATENNMMPQNMAPDVLQEAYLTVIPTLNENEVNNVNAQLEMWDVEIPSIVDISETSLTDTENAISDTNPIMPIELDRDSTLLNANLIAGDISKIRPTMTVDVNLSANSDQINEMARAAVRQALADAYE